MDTLQNMRVFVRVVEAGSFTGAAQHLNTTTAYASRARSGWRCVIVTMSSSSRRASSGRPTLIRFSAMKNRWNRIWRCSGGK